MMMAILIKPVNRVKKAKTRNGQEVLARLQEFLEQDADTGKLVEILCGFWEDQQDAVSYQELRQIVLDGTVSKEMLKLWSQDYSKLVADTLSGAWTAAARAGVSGQPVLDRIPFEFNTQKPGILNWLNCRGAEFVTSSTEEQKRAVEALLTKKMLDGHTVDELSRMIRPCIGLTEGQARANARYYDNIVETLRKEHPRMKDESVQAKAREAAMKYAERQHRYRAMTIAQTESAFAYNRGADEGVRQAQAQGLLGKTIKRWSTSGDDQVCSICQGFEGTEAEMDKGFPFKGKSLFQGQDLLPPAHPRCACAVEYVEVEERIGNSAVYPEDNRHILEMMGDTEQKIEEDDSFRRVLNEYKEKLKITYDNMTRNDPPIALSELRGCHARNIQEIIENAPEHYRKFLETNGDKIFFLKTDTTGHNRFSSMYNGIFINFKRDEHDNRGTYTATFHEMGHHVDSMLGRVSRSGDFGKFLRTDAQNFVIAYAQLNGYNVEEALYEISDAMRKAESRQCHIMADLFSGIYGNEYDWKYYHADSYWAREGKLESEAFAHFFSASVLADAEKMETIQSVFPNAYQWFDGIF